MNVPLRDIKIIAKPALAPAQRLAAQAARLWPESEALQVRWIAAVKMVRSTTRGWVCDRSALTPTRGSGHA